MAEKPAPPSEVIATYLITYELANGVPFPSEITYESGWFVFRQPYTSRHRRAEVVGMISALRARKSA